MSVLGNEKKLEVDLLWYYGMYMYLISSISIWLGKLVVKLGHFTLTLLRLLQGKAMKGIEREKEREREREREREILCTLLLDIYMYAEI